MRCCKCGRKLVLLGWKQRGVGLEDVREVVDYWCENCRLIFSFEAVDVICIDKDEPYLRGEK